MTKEEFANWLIDHTKLSSSTIEKYTNAIRTISKELSRNNVINSNLYNISDPALVEELTHKYFSIPEFQEKDIRGNRMYSNALNYYKKFTGSFNEKANIRQGVIKDESKNYINNNEIVDHIMPT